MRTPAQSRRLMDAARRRNRRRDGIDRANGFAAPGDVGDTELLATVLAALVCGITAEDWEPVAEAAAMLECRAGITTTWPGEDR